MKPLEHGQMLKEVFEERINSLNITKEYYETLKESVTTEKAKAKYDILSMEVELSLVFLNDRLEALTEVLEIHEKIENADLSFTEKLACMAKVMQIMNDL
ncbi:hypothetical protein [Clostridium saccharoperbutylacetonicum]|uniref:hypothetical protein n=1 Tax=Clostridium saccharoperbutylacetonicum TaxID=36745 RepID=UPI000983C79D|nr:hypothetical protein [Clostridium saccharoperbutylacetonicum]AQR98136.1 hypothetical protein CLSAP_54870 [Clostridium saccharoperbutylacetonicum]NSB34029.1 ribosome assembly protein YihI (activator of Der GTPase) [Clostridium saccharoperbutylacetonicum]